MSVHPNKSKVTGKVISWTVRYRDHTDTQQRALFKGPGAHRRAKEFDAEVSAAKAHGKSTDHLARRGQTLQEVAEQLIATTARDLTHSTRRNDEMAYRLHIYPTLGSRPINSISVMDVQSWYNELREKTSDRTKQPLSDSTVHNTGVTLSKTFDFALRLGLIETNPYSHIIKARTRRKRRPFLTMPQVRRIGELMDEHEPNGLILRFAAFTGLRSGEQAALRIGDVTTMTGAVASRVSVSKQRQNHADADTKTDAGVRHPPLSGPLKQELEDYFATHPHRHDPTAPLWPGRQPGTKGHPAGLDYDRPFDIASLKRYYFKPVLKRLGLEDFSWHDLRHFYATTLVHSRRYSDKQVQEWMGHASYAFTLDRYGHAPEEEIVSMPFDDIYARSNVTPMERRAV
jgi:integrase